MPVYRFDGSKRADKKITAAQIHDINGVLRYLTKGDTIELSPDQLDLHPLIQFSDTTDPVPSAPMGETMVRVIGDPEPGKVLVAQGLGLPAIWSDAPAGTGTGAVVIGDPPTLLPATTIETFTTTTLPDLLAYRDTLIFVSDAPQGEQFVISDGINWRKPGYGDVALTDL